MQFGTSTEESIYMCSDDIEVTKVNIIQYGENMKHGLFSELFSCNTLSHTPVHSI